jgi:hypothetical protein
MKPGGRSSPGFMILRPADDEHLTPHIGVVRAGFESKKRNPVYSRFAEALIFNSHWTLHFAWIVLRWRWSPTLDIRRHGFCRRENPRRQLQ